MMLDTSHDYLMRCCLWALNVSFLCQELGVMRQISFTRLLATTSDALRDIKGHPMINILLSLRPHKMRLQRYPTLLVVILLDLPASLQTPLSDTDHKTTLKHERHTALTDLDGLEVCIARFVMRAGIRSMSRHDVM